MIRADRKKTKHHLVKYLVMLFPRASPLIPRLKSSYTPPPLKKQRHFCVRISVLHKIVGTRNFLSPYCNKRIEDSLAS